MQHWSGSTNSPYGSVPRSALYFVELSLSYVKALGDALSKSKAAAAAFVHWKNSLALHKKRWLSFIQLEACRLQVPVLFQRLILSDTAVNMGWVCCFMDLRSEHPAGQYFSLQTPPVVACLTSDVHLLYTGKKLEYPNQDVYRPFAFDKSIK
ncbi:hypothetical protein T4D_10338 [Trichinella pseudospiralis]|uniref:Uncharacterized protein n=1 Tax=Trichinella pseudospiralis TaxID=6337 RepID=A0A0V1G2A7_TRIPS|nr:hypothetical protein T4D_10338 [Trichinella pseudospiralis]